VIRLYDNYSGVEIGAVTNDQLQFLIDQLEEESTRDQDYYIDQATLEMFVDAGIDEGLLELLRGALGDRDGMEIRWQKES
jgi:predicted transcriptional regulator